MRPDISSPRAPMDFGALPPHWPLDIGMSHVDAYCAPWITKGCAQTTITTLAPACNETLANTMDRLDGQLLR